MDNYPGFPEIGHKAADEILNPMALLDADPREDLAALWDDVVKTYTTRIPRGGKSRSSTRTRSHKSCRANDEDKTYWNGEPFWNVYAHQSKGGVN